MSHAGIIIGIPGLEVVRVKSKHCIDVRARPKSNAQFVVMDLSETYHSISRQYFPDAPIVADRIHVVRLINQHFLRLWQQHDPEG